MKMRWTPEEGLILCVFREARQQLKYIGKESTHTPGTIRVIPSGVLNRLTKLTSQKPSLPSEGVDKVYPTTQMLSARRAFHLLISQQWESYGKRRMKKRILRTKEPDVNKKKNRTVYFCVAYSRYFSTYIHRVINRLKKNLNLLWLRVRMSYHRFNNLSELLNRDLAVKIGRGIFSKDLMDRKCNCYLPSKFSQRKMCLQR